MDIRQIGSAPSAQPFSDRISHTDTVPSENLTTPQSSGLITPVTSASKTTDTNAVDKAVADINKVIQSLSQNLQFSVDKDSKRVVVKVIDQQTNQVLRQIPSEEALEISKSLDKLQGLLIRQQV
ncbi:flagellar protein FlaG [Undibacterium oligocarboniphilum]|uniref:Flagellar protein FlaG n=1 Tax=Undibacterium oligocarboniphilum TaxID=666702 RepID=A0A850QCV4_9BURK|nr:flagellar protein FlaG [Undibacterium oligocarboniphilum]MBC3870271.1 flagellar protein FlaG [Undibacterium oligocarboniphilum]NVO78262.1 flagellar protein FlaG [Undibacterium oligocarboniphilum]